MYSRRHKKNVKIQGGLTIQITHAKQSQRGRSGQIYWDQVRDLKPDFLNPQWLEMKKYQCLSSRGLPEESETHPDLDPSANIEGVMIV